MINIYSNIMSLWPASIVMSPKLSRLTPSITQVWDYDRISPASAVGGAEKSVQGAIGEFLERKHFFNEIIPVSEKRITDMMPEPSAGALIAALMQTSGEKEAVIRQHTFRTVNAFNPLISDKIEIPAILIALDNISVRDDYRFYPFRDTCGCSCHVKLHKAVQGSLAEFIERQSLLRYWLTGSARGVVEPDTTICPLYVSELVKDLKNEGELMLLDITLPGAPGYVILSLYGTSKKGNSIRYGAGLSYSDNRRDAAEKSLVELWQSYICMHNFTIGGYETEDILDRYQIHFQSCNSYETYRDMLNNTKIDLASEGVGNSESGVLDFMSDISKNIFMYMSRERVRDDLVWYVKIISPDFFMHMDNSSPLNLDNKIYTRGLGIKHREKIMVPFP